VRIDGVLSLPQYTLPQERKEAMLLERALELTEHHRAACPAYARILDARGYDAGSVSSLADVPSLPIGLFKTHRLSSITQEQVFKVVTSSGTTGSEVSRVELDRAAAIQQTQALASIMKHWLGDARLPMIVVDAKETLRNRAAPSARSAGIIGMATFGRDQLYVLDEDMSLRRDALHEWLQRHAGSPLLLFGFTFMVWRYFVQALAPGEVDLSAGVLVHSGGWKKLADDAVDDAGFRAALADVTGLRRVHNFYGMAEQIGTVFVQCQAGQLHAPNAADVIVRDSRTWAPSPTGEVGVVQVLSMLPESYPGHSLLTEDLGRIVAVDGCECGRLGKALRIEGRVPAAELRGCSDTHREIGTLAAA
jgi:Acyl-protein synthetase, LuxE